MFEAALGAKLKKIFDLKKVSYDLPGESEEQECIFIQVEKAIPRLKDQSQTCRVEGKLHIFCNAQKLPYGYFQKKIGEAEASDTRDLFFFGMEENVNQFKNISERSMGFVYLFDSQHDPEVGTIEEIQLETQVSE